MYFIPNPFIQSVRCFYIGVIDVGYHVGDNWQQKVCINLAFYFILFILFTVSQTLKLGRILCREHAIASYSLFTIERLSKQLETK